MAEEERNPRSGGPPQDAERDDQLVRREERQAAVEAGRVGGPAPETEGDEAARPVEEGGGGEGPG